MEERAKKMDDDWFKGRTVLDLGCNNGYFVRHALKHGAKRAVGVDKSDCIIGARELAKQEGLTKAEFWQVDLDSKEFRRFCPRFDTVLLLSVLTHVNDKEEFLDWLDSIIKWRFIFESNHGEKNKQHIELVNKHIYFEKITYLGTTDIPEKPHHLWLCEKPSHEVRYNWLGNLPVEFVPLEWIKGWSEDKLFEQKYSYALASEKQIALMMDIKKRGFREPLILQEYKGELLGFNGIHRYFIAKTLGYKNVPVKIMRNMGYFKHLGQKHE
jgi:SAM-dependent methyltransferase